MIVNLPTIMSVLTRPYLSPHLAVTDLLAILTLYQGGPPLPLFLLSLSMALLLHLIATMNDSLARLIIRIWSLIRPTFQINLLLIILTGTLFYLLEIISDKTIPSLPNIWYPDVLYNGILLLANIYFLTAALTSPLVIVSLLSTLIQTLILISLVVSATPRVPWTCPNNHRYTLLATDTSKKFFSASWAVTVSFSFSSMPTDSFFMTFINHIVSCSSSLSMKPCWKKWWKDTKNYICERTRIRTLTVHVFQDIYFWLRCHLIIHNSFSWI